MRVLVLLAALTAPRKPSGPSKPPPPPTSAASTTSARASPGPRARTAPSSAPKTPATSGSAAPSHPTPSTSTSAASRPSTPTPPSSCPPAPATNPASTKPPTAAKPGTSSSPTPTKKASGMQYKFDTRRISAMSDRRSGRRKLSQFVSTTDDGATAGSRWTISIRTSRKPSAANRQKRCSRQATPRFCYVRIPNSHAWLEILFVTGGSESLVPESTCLNQRYSTDEGNYDRSTTSLHSLADRRNSGRIFVSHSAKIQETSTDA